ncbi:MAG: protein-export membrane protein SecF [Candidatus Niyogibacteria bacterium RIFCSPLOWO2_01_FULL_45_48]|uniref:Protein-export membrane protein SecF n=2 Tax=Candidatus Niyogiibacteriota TaxID=1817912 RepID=A0A1G2EXN3_9BACT|nr:MAG: protein-export membrane protein SecF [Candidatus Niyogibacteria bacterium RIFCSPHIGHO2_01_FULL_45_28]OGZ30535.1 MAG: protein-export membrane protein SecF [Candidatus Niyogibacteria bacterium RIFCSPLOWO2_01_FULL_45_48]OGZ30559.1 MAG: protein-export membrane protein SecF [Candidatus Niyogibacteria bacterium RIFCSPLOWO2_02_FULL_45_13]
MLIIRFRKFLYIFSFLVLATSLFGVLAYGFRLGVDFSGGSILEVEFLGERPDTALIDQKISDLNLSSYRVQPAGDNGFIVRVGELPPEGRQDLIKALAGSDEPEKVLSIRRFDSIGPTIGRELRRNAFVSIALVIVLILAFVSWAFRHVSKPVASWKYGVVAILALIHDILIPAGLFAYLGRFYGAEVDALFVTALLTILGFSVHDTIVVFDRIRENLRKSEGVGNFESIVGKSLDETYGRSLATSFAIFLVLASLFWFGASATRYFALTLLIGVIAGTYSSICLASPLLVSWQKRSGKLN